MTRLLPIAALLWLVLGCGRYGPPVRAHGEPPAAPAVEEACDECDEGARQP